jgi:GlpG protein
MRLIGAIKDEQQAQRFAAYLVTLGVSNSIDFESSAWQVWVCDEDSVEKATGELRSFNENPNAVVSSSRSEGCKIASWGT